MVAGLLVPWRDGDNPRIGDLVAERDGLKR